MVVDQVQNIKKRSIRTITMIFASGNMIAMVLRMAGGFLTARFCDPSVLGLFNGMGLVLGYATFLQLGVLNGLNRELPYYIGANDIKQAHGLAATSQAWALIIGGIVAGGLLVFGSWQMINGRIELAIGWSTYAVSAFLMFYAQLYLQITYRTGGDFSRLAVINVTQYAISLVMVWLVWMFSFYGLCMRALAVALINLLMLWMWRPLKIKPKFKKKYFLKLLRIGVPIFGAGQLWVWWVVTDSAMVLKFMGATGLGLYQLAVMTGQGIEVLPNALAQICYPRMAKEYGRTKSVAYIINIILRPTIILLLCIIPIVILSWLVLPPIVQLLLPKYSEAVPAVQWTLCSSAILSLSTVGDVFSVTKKLGLYIAAICIGIITYAIVLYFLSRTGVTLKMFPQAMLCGRLVYILFCFTMIIRMKNREKGFNIA